MRAARKLLLLRKRATGGAASPLLTDLAAYWKLDDLTWPDSVGSVNLTNNGSVTVGTPKLGAGSAEFDGTNFLDTVDDPPLDLTNVFSVSCWIRATSLNNQIIFAKDIYSTQRGVSLRFNNTGNISVFYGETLTSTSITTRVTTTSTFSTAVWHHAVLTMDNGFLSIYVNGNQEVGVTLAVTAFPDNTSPFSIGTWPGIGGQNFLGEIDEVGIWSRALTSGEISDLYNSGSGLSYPF